MFFMSDPETKVSKKIGLISRDQAATLRSRGRGDFSIVVDPPDGASKWCDAKTQAIRDANFRSPTNATPIPNRREMMELAQSSRLQGLIPVVIETEGEPEEIQGFLNQSGLAELEFVP